MVAGMTLWKMTAMSIAGFRKAERILSLDLCFNIRFFVRKYHLRLNTAQIQSAKADTPCTNRLTPTFPDLPNVDVLDEENGGSNAVGCAYGRIRSGQATSFESHTNLLLVC